MTHREKRNGETIVPASEFLKRRPTENPTAKEAFDRKLHSLRKKASEGDLTAKKELRTLHGQE